MVFIYCRSRKYNVQILRYVLGLGFLQQRPTALKKRSRTSQRIGKCLRVVYENALTSFVCVDTFYVDNASSECGVNINAPHALALRYSDS